ncbi:hypothetical protein MPER_03238 [Moniliophthora perniciosa FA553]|nr:hypothetical protein MPER_03238 [Moniliophthora perniciosa FA553]
MHIVAFALRTKSTCRTTAFLTFRETRETGSAVRPRGSLSALLNASNIHSDD